MGTKTLSEWWKRRDVGTGNKDVNDDPIETYLPTHTTFAAEESRNVALIRYFAIEQFSSFKRYVLRTQFFPIENASPGYVDALVWLVAWAFTLSFFLFCTLWVLMWGATSGKTAFAAPRSDKPGAKDTILVVVQLTGGNDGLNTVVPFADPEYAKLRPTIGIKKAEVKKLTDSLGLHPATLRSRLRKLGIDWARYRRR